MLKSNAYSSNQMNSIPHFFLQFSHCMSDFQFSAVQNRSDVNPLRVPPENQNGFILQSANVSI